MSTRSAKEKSGRHTVTGPMGDHLSDLGNARAFVRDNGADVRWCDPWKKFVVWDGGRWILDNVGEVYLRAKQTIGKRWKQVQDVPEHQRRAYVEHVLESESAPRIEAMLKLARSEPGIPVLPEQFDARHDLFNCMGATLDIKAMKARAPDRGDYLMKQSPIKWPSEKPRCPTWLASLDRWAKGNQALVSYLQQWSGYCMTGCVKEQQVTFFHGDGANGKTTYLNVLSDIFGDYAMKAPPGLLMSRSHEAHPTQLASMHGKRLVFANESEENRSLNEVLVKELSGGDPITGRRMREDFWTYMPTHKLAMATNYKPKISGTDLGIWRRIHLFPFNVTIPEGERDKDLPEKLRAEYPAILVWLAIGAADWLKNGLTVPDEIRAATTAYRGDQDVLRIFVEECCLTGTNAYRARKSELYAAYEKWAEQNGEKPVSGRRLGDYLLAKGYERHVSNGTWYVGIGVREDF